MFKKIKRFLRQRKKIREYKKFILQHKKNIMKACYEMLNCPDLEWICKDDEIITNLWYRALDHDDSKYEWEEFDAYRKNYFPVDIQEQEENTEDFKKALEHHIANNDHHWQHRTTWKDEDFDINTELACLENIMDWLAKGYQYNIRPSVYYEAHKQEISLPKKQREFIEKCLYQGIDKQYIEEGNNEIFEEK